jgi:crossover junction endodeoxyribonuclease RuvC
MNILGLDLSLTSTGFCSNGYTGVYKPKSKGAERLSEVSGFVLTQCISSEISCVIIEGYSFASRNSQAHSIGEMGGCVRMTLWKNLIPYIEVPPTSRAKFATGKGNAGKAEVVSAISSKTGKLFSGSGADDECDAWVLEQMGLQKLGMSNYSWTKEQLSALDKIDWSPLDKLVNGEK